MVSSTRDLGVLISDTLSWSDHIHRITSKAYKMFGLVHRSFSNKLPVSVKKSLYLSLVRSHLMYCSVIWRPYLCKDIILLEKIQRRASKFLLNDYSSDYKTRLMSLNLLPLSMVMELNDIIFFLKSLRTPLSTFNLTSWTMSVSATLLHGLLQVINFDTIVPPPPFLLISTFQDSLVFGTVSLPLIHSTFLYPQLYHT